MKTEIIDNFENESKYNFFHPYFQYLKDIVHNTFKHHSKIIITVPDLKYFPYSFILYDAFEAAKPIKKNIDYNPGQILCVEDVFIKYESRYNETLHKCKFKGKIIKTLTEDQILMFSPVLNSRKLSEYSEVKEKLNGKIDSIARTLEKKVLILDNIIGIESALCDMKMSNLKIKSRVNFHYIDHNEEISKFNENTIYYTKNIMRDFKKISPEILYIVSHKLLSNQISFVHENHDFNILIFCDCFDLKTIRSYEEYGYKPIKFEFNKFNDMGNDFLLVNLLKAMDKLKENIQKKIQNNEQFIYDNEINNSGILEKVNNRDYFENIYDKKIKGISTNNNTFFSFRNLSNSLSISEILKTYLKHSFSINETISCWIVSLLEKKLSGFNDIDFSDFRESFIITKLEKFEDELKRFLLYIGNLIDNDIIFLDFIKRIIIHYTHYKEFSDEKSLTPIFKCLKDSIIKADYDVSMKHIENSEIRSTLNLIFVDYGTDDLDYLLKKLYFLKKDIEDNDFNQIYQLIFQKFIYRILFQLSITDKLNKDDYFEEIDYFFENCINKNFDFLTKNELLNIKDFFEELKIFLFLLEEDHNVFNYYMKIIETLSNPFERIGIFINNPTLDIDSLKINSIDIHINDYGKKYDTLIAFFPPKKKLNKIIMGNLSKKIIIVNYSFLLFKQKKHLKKIFSYNKLSNLNNIDISSENDKYSDFKFSTLSNINQLHALKPEETFVKVLMFKNNKVLLLRENGSVFCFTNNHVIEKKCRDLKRNDICMIISNDKENRDKILLNMLKQENIENYKSYCTIWKKALQKYLYKYDLYDLKNDLSRNGISLCHNTIKNWINNDNIIGPKKYSHFIAIKNITNDPDFNANYKDVWEAISTLRGKSICAGKSNIQLILKYIKSNNKEIKINEDLVIENIGKVSFYEFDFIYRKCKIKNCYIDKILEVRELNRILKDV